MLDVSKDEFIVLDTETTGIDPEMGHKVIEIGAIKIINGEISNIKFHHYIDPQREIPFEASEIHGMTRQDCVELGKGQVFKDIADDFEDFVVGKVVVAHNASFDFGFLDHELSLIGRPPISERCKVIDSLGYANGISPSKKNSLDQLAKRYGVNDFDRSFHGALLDSCILAKVFMAMRISQKHLSMSDVIKSTDAKQRTFNLSDIIKPISQNIAVTLPTVNVSNDDNMKHQAYLTGIDKDLTW